MAVLRPSPIDPKRTFFTRAGEAFALARGQGRGFVAKRVNEQLLRYVFNSFFSSVSKRQSVPSAMSCCGDFFTIPASLSLRA
jgi:hypothetical protein